MEDPTPFTPDKMVKASEKKTAWDEFGKITI